MQKQIEEEIEDEIVLADEQYQQAKAAHAEIAKKRKLQGIRKVGHIESFLSLLWAEYPRPFNRRKKHGNGWIENVKRQQQPLKAKAIMIK